MANPRMKSPPRRRDEISIASEILPDGRYGIVLAYGKNVRWLDKETVYRHCQAVVQATVRAEHDAAVFRQLHFSVGLPVDVAGDMVERLRKRRNPLDAQALQPLSLEPGVTIAGKPFLGLLVNGHKVGQWGPEEARQHAVGCLELAAAVDLDNAYRDVLMTEVGVEENRVAYGMVGELSKELTLYTVVKK